MAARDPGGLLDHDPYDEQAHQQLIRTLHRAGRHGEADRRYRAYAARMAEIGIVPTPPGTGISG